VESLKQRLTNIVSEAFTAAGLDQIYGEVVVSNRPDLGHFQCNGASAAAQARQASWLGLAALFLTTLSLVLDLLGIAIPKRM
jgi:arginyl-tRNA synthetase